jgi:DNA-binding transcriptional regulator GbsR (MarR family)
MKRDDQLLYADHVGRFYARHFGFPPMAGRLLGYLTVCVPERQSIGDLTDALLASRSAVTGAIQTLELHHLVRRTRAAGERSDSVGIDPVGFESRGFDATRYQEQVALFREGLEVLSGDAPDQRASVLEDAIALAEFLAEQMPALYRAWETQRDTLRQARTQGSTRGTDDDLTKGRMRKEHGTR